MRSTGTGRLAVGLLSVAALLAGPVAAQSADKPPAQQQAPPVRPEAQPDSEFLVKPPAQGNPRLVKPAPADRDPGLVKTPPADPKPAGEDKENKPRADDPKAPSREDDCRGTVEDCKQNSPR